MRNIKALLICFILSFSFFSLSSSANTQFSDVTGDRFSAKAINKMTELKIVKGYEDGTFKPTNYVTRAELAKIVSTIALVGETPNKPESQNLVDVPSSHWAADVINYVVKQGYMKPNSSNLFEPNRNVTRGEFANVLWNMRTFVVPDSHQINFVDIPQSSPYYESVRALTYFKITSGTSATEFSPNQPLTREQIAVFFDREGSLDSGITFTKKISLSKYHTKGEKLLSAAKFEEMIKQLENRRLNIFPIANDTLPIIHYNSETKELEFHSLQFQSIPPDGEHFYYMKYAVWGDSTKGEHLVKMKFVKGKFTGFKLYTEKEVKNLKETIFKSDLLFNEFVKKNNLDYINFHDSTDDITFNHFNRSEKGQYFTYFKPHFLGDKSEFRVKLPETDILLEFNVVEKDGVISYTFKEVTGDLFIPLTNKNALSFKVALNNESINETSFVSFNDEGAQLYKPAPNTLPEGTKIIFYDDIPKVAVYMDGGFTELEPVKFPTKGKRVRTTGIDVPSEYSHISYGQHEVIAGKDAVYFFNHPIDPLPIGGSISYTLGENEYFSHIFTGNGFVEGDDISKKEIALTVPVGNAAIPTVTYKYKGEVLIDHELVSFKDNNIYIYEPNENKLKDGTTIIFHYDVPKVFTYTNGKYIEMEPKLLRVLSGEMSGFSIIFPQGSEGHNYNQHNFIDGKEGYYYFESVHERLPVGTVIELYDGGHLVKYKYNGTSFEAQSGTLGKKVAVAVPIINNQNAVYQVKYDGSFVNADFIKIENGYFNIYEPDPNVVKDGTTIIISDDIPKMFVYMNGQLKQAKAYKVPAYNAEFSGVGMSSNPENPNFKPYLVEYAMGKDGFYIFDSELAPLYPGFIFEVGFGRTIYGYTFNGSGFVPN